MELSRRRFIAGGAALTAAAAAGGDGAAPDIRIGLLSDIHLFDYKRSARNFIRALKILRRMNVDVVVITGDMAHTGRVSELKNVAASWNEVFPGDRYPDGRKIERVFVCGNHDVSRRPARYLKLTREEFDRQAFYTQKEAVWRECFGEDFAPVSIREVRGYKFVLAHWDDSATVKGAAAFIRAHADELRGGKPFFYLQHAHPSGTAPGHGHDDGSVAEALSEFPNAVSVSGHSHRPLTDERSMIWQGAFTAVNASNVIEAGYRYSDPAFENGDRPELAGRKVGDLLTPVVDAYTGGPQGLVLDVYGDRLVFRRHSFAYDEPCGADWSVPFPAREDTPFATALRKAAAQAPRFAPGAEITVEKVRCLTRAKKEADGIKVSFPLAKGRGEGGRAFAYEVTATDPSGASKPIVRSILSPDYHLPPTRLMETASIVFAAAELKAGLDTRFTVRPFDSHRNYGPALAMTAGMSAQPLFRVGIMSDTHVGKTVESCSHVRSALELFKSKGADMVINCGDIADRYYPSGYRAYRQVFEEVHRGGVKPRELYVYAWHDAFEFKSGVPRGDTEKYSAEAFEEVRRHLEAPNAHTEEVEFKGYPFLVFPQHIGFPGFIGYDEYEKRIAAACKAYPGKPVFVVDHPPARGTTYNSDRWGDGTRGRILRRYPQAVALNGHTHGTLRMHHQIWQGEFTAVNAACLYYWGGGKKPRRAYGVLTMDVYPERLVFRRWDIRDGSEIRADRPWTVMLPFAPETAPCNHARLAEELPATPFTSDAKVSASPQDAKGRFEGVALRFPETGGDTYSYRIEAQRRVRGAWRTFAWESVHSDFWQRPSERTGTASALFPDGKLEPKARTRFKVSPVSHFRVVGPPKFSKAVAVPGSPEWKTVYSTDDPSKDLAYVYAKGGGRIKSGDDGFHAASGSRGSRLELPAGVFAGPEGTVFRVIVDMRTKQPPMAWLWRLRLVDGASGKAVTKLQSTPDGDSGDQRWVFELVKSAEAAGDTFHLGFDWGTTSEVRFNALKIERSNS